MKPILRVTCVVLGMCGLVGAFAHVGQAQTYCCPTSTTTWSPDTSISRYTLGCDSNEKTPTEAIQCKVEFWQKQVKERQETAERAQKALDEAKERLAAFRQVQHDGK